MSNEYLSSGAGIALLRSLKGQKAAGTQILVKAPFHPSYLSIGTFVYFQLENGASSRSIRRSIER